MIRSLNLCNCNKVNERIRFKHLKKNTVPCYVIKDMSDSVMNPSSLMDSLSCDIYNTNSYCRAHGSLKPATVTTVTTYWQTMTKAKRFFLFFVLKLDCLLKAMLQTQV